MTPITPATITRHELIGLSARVVEADNPDLVGLAGRVVDETRNTLRIDDGGTTKTVPKRVATFEVALPDGEYVVVNGDTLVARPARRNEAVGGSKWHSA